MKSYQNDDLIPALRKGDQAAFREFFDATFHEMCRFALGFKVNSDFAEDTVIESYEKLWAIRENFNSTGSLIAFLRITIRNACLNELTRINRYPHSPSDEHHNITAGDDNELEKFQLKEAALEIIYQEIENLPDQCQKIFKHYYFYNLPTDVIAIQMDLSPQTVRNQLTRARQLLRTVLLKNGLDSTLVLIIISRIFRAIY